MSEVSDIGEQAGEPEQAQEPGSQEPSALESQDQAEQVRTKLWDRDTGTLRRASRTVLIALLKGPYVSA